RVFINELVCEGCGDCSRESNCLSVVPVETEFGRKRAIDQSSCNKDFSCLKGVCPSFVTIEGGQLRKGRAQTISHAHFPLPPQPALPATTRPWSILVTGVGGTGVVTIGALVGMAAHLDGRGISVLDMTGLAQKFGAVYSHLRIADKPEDLHAVRIATGEADAIIGGDLIVSAGSEALAKMLAGHTRAVINCTASPTAEFTRDPDWTAPTEKLRAQVSETLGHTEAAPSAWFLDAQLIATRLMGDAVFANLFLLGFAWQKSLVPVSHDAMMRAIEMNGVAVDDNKKAFLWGRRAAVNLAEVLRIATPGVDHCGADGHRFSKSLDDVIARRVDFLTGYQDASYAERYRSLVEQVRQTEASYGSSRIADAVARQYFRLLAIKDEYEVARLHTAPEFQQEIGERFEGDFKLHFHFAPPLWAKADPATGKIAKTSYGPWMFTALRLLAKLKGLRGTSLDLFALSEERKLERALIGEYEADVIAIVKRLQGGAASPETLAAAQRLADWPAGVRGFGYIRRHSVDAVRQQTPGWRDALQI
ncbi:MAG TPA: DUF6537 domain-containing protein, partial [Rhodocyclaceae bacterium]|nr:DUF6537 domain-containing protein [Rhodocyclaceae bacterium]